jgi:Flp pilus assembly protein TadD
MHVSRFTLATLTTIALASAAAGAQTPQQQPDPRADSLRQAQSLDVEGKHADARAIFQKLIDTAPDAAAKAAATRRLAMSYGYDGNCARVIELEEQVIAYWRTRREAEPQNAYYQEGEMANEAARVCHDAGSFDEAERMYRRGSELGNMEPAPRTHPESLWDYRLAHALARISARRGDAGEAKRWIAEARKALDSDPEMAKAQERYFPYLLGYVALFTGDLATAETELKKASELMPNDPFQIVLLGMTYEKRGDQTKAAAMYEKAFEMSTGSNPPNIYSRRFTREKLGKD